MSTPESDDYQETTERVRKHVTSRYLPLVADYLTALREGDDLRAAAVARQLEEASNKLDSLWTGTSFSDALVTSNAVNVNEAAAAWAMFSDLWADIAQVHSERNQT